MLKTTIEQQTEGENNDSYPSPRYGSGVRTYICNRTSTSHDSIQDACLNKQRVLPTFLERLLPYPQKTAIVRKSETEVKMKVSQSRRNLYHDRSDTVSTHSHPIGGSN